MPKDKKELTAKPSTISKKSTGNKSAVSVSKKSSKLKQKSSVAASKKKDKKGGGKVKGFDSLEKVDSFFIKLNSLDEDVLNSFMFKNEFAILDKSGTRLFLAGEKSTNCSALCLGRARPFLVLITNEKGKIIMKVKRNYSYCLFFCNGDCCGSECVIVDRKDQLIAKVSEVCGGTTPSYIITKSSGTKMFIIEGPKWANLCTSCKTADKFVFKLKNMEGKIIGLIMRKWHSLIDDFFTSADVFGIKFSSDLSVFEKTIILGAIFLIDLQYYEKAEVRTIEEPERTNSGRMKKRKRSEKFSTSLYKFSHKSSVYENNRGCVSGFCLCICFIIIFIPTIIVIIYYTTSK